MKLSVFILFFTLTSLNAQPSTYYEASSGAAAAITINKYCYGEDVNDKVKYDLNFMMSHYDDYSKKYVFDELELKIKAFSISSGYNCINMDKLYSLANDWGFDGYLKK